MTTLTTTVRSPLHTARRAAGALAAFAVALAMLITWGNSSPANAAPTRAAKGAAATSSAATTVDDAPTKRGGKELTGKLNLNTATEDQLMMLPGVGPAKMERIVAFRQKSGGFKRVADLRKVKGFGYKSLKKLEPYLDIKGDTTLAE